jgi:hypothetical protein
MKKIKNTFEINKIDYMITMGIYAITMVVTLVYIAQ